MPVVPTSSPHTLSQNRTQKVMIQVILATLPGLAIQCVFFGWGNLINVIWCSLIAIAAETAVLVIRKRPVMFYLADCSALVTGVLLGLALPPFAPWWTTSLATAFAIIFAKQIYGGLGYNPFNPAMVGYALVLVSFPVTMTTTWASPSGLLNSPDLVSTLSLIFSPFSAESIDAFTMATPLDTYKHEIIDKTAEVVFQNPVFGNSIAAGWQWINLAFLAGGIYLIGRKVITWHAPIGMLAGICIPSLTIGWDWDTTTPISLHLLAGSTMLGAFFIITDPVTGPASHRGKLIYGLCAGVLVYTIRVYGNYPDAVAFSVLLMNFTAPFIDYYTQPRTYGHQKPNSGIKGNNP
ncbi:MAG: electron transport complex subunit RsxD [Gammaproteobacteria bacterium]|nr:MAG: electron transport complex subunit RsxD [Gammaproteobacteria bacterium]